MKLLLWFLFTMAEYHVVLRQNSTIQQFVDTYDVVAIAVQETKLCDRISDKQLEIKGFNLFRQDRTENGGGVALYIRSDLIPRRVVIQNLSPHLELVAAMFKYRNRYLFATSACRPPNQPAAARDETLDSLADFLAGLGDNGVKNLLFGGDLNFDALDVPYFRPVQEILDEFNLIEGVDFVTHRMQNAETCLDLLVYGDRRLVAGISSFAPLDGHHDTMGLALRRNVQKPLPERRPIRLWRRADWDAIRNDILTANLNQIVEEAPNVHEATRRFTDAINQIMDARIPTKNVRFNPKHLGLSRPLRNLRRKKDCAYKQAKRSGRMSDWAKYHKKKKRLRKELPKSREAAISKLFSEVSNAADFWKVIRKVEGNERPPIPPLEADNGAYIVDNLGKAEVLADHFQSVYNLEQDVIPEFPKIPVPAEFLCRDDFILEEIFKVRNKCAPGPDSIWPCMLKETAAYLAGPLAKIINRSLTEMEFPTSWKETYISPIPKKPNDLTKKDFRPITLTPIIARISEAHVIDLMRPSIGERLSKNHFAYQKGKGTVDALQFHEHLICQGFEACRAQNRPTNVVGVFCDVQKAFDSVTFGSLLSLLERDFELHPVLLQWLKSYLRGRSFKVRVGNSFSVPRPVLSGVPQGSKLGPMLFNAYMNSVADLELSENAALIVYADDVAYVKPIVTEEGKDELQQDLDKLDTALNHISLTLNVEKTKLMRFSVSPALPDPPVAQIRGQPVERVDKFRYLGVTFDERMSWKLHTKAKAVGLKRETGALNAVLGKQRGHDTFRKIYCQQILPRMTYAINVWYPPLVESRIQLEKAQKFALRTIQRNYTRNYQDLLAFSRVPPLGLTAANFRCRLVYLWYRELHFWPNPLQQTRDLQLRRAQRLVRNEQSYQLPVCRLGRADVSCAREAVRIWNRIPTEWVELDKQSFHAKLAQHDLLEGLLATPPPIETYSAFQNV